MRILSSSSTVAVKLTRRHVAPTEELDRLLDINVKGTFFSYKYAVIQLIKQGNGGRIIGAASIASKQGQSDVTYVPRSYAHSLQPRLTGIALHSAYCATKFAIRGMTQSAAMDYGKYGITVNVYAPGAIETPLRECTAFAVAAVLTSASPYSPWIGRVPFQVERAAARHVEQFGVYLRAWKFHLTNIRPLLFSFVVVHEHLGTERTAGGCGEASVVPRVGRCGVHHW